MHVARANGSMCAGRDNVPWPRIIRDTEMYSKYRNYPLESHTRCDLLQRLINLRYVAESIFFQHLPIHNTS